jgi:small-conductance mechanosensitive channel
MKESEEKKEENVSNEIHIDGIDATTLSDIEEALDDVYGSTKLNYHSKRQARTSFHTKEKIEILLYVLALIGLILLHFAFHLDQLPIEEKYTPFVPRVVVGFTLVLLVGLGTLLVNTLWINAIDDQAEKHNLKQVIKILRNSSLLFIGLSIIYADWYTAFISLGILSIVLGFSLQTPILSFIAWIYIIVRKPYKIGDTIQVGEDSGEVIDIDYLDTTIWEVRNSNMNADHPSGRIIRFPNSNILNASVFNYSWALFPYIYDEILFYTDYKAPLSEIAVLLKEIAQKNIPSDQGHKIKEYKKLLINSKISIDNINEEPEVVFKPTDASTIQIVLIYPVLTKDSGKIKGLITNEILLRNLQSKGVMLHQEE